MQSGHHSNIDSRSVQINGMQVRDLGEVTDSAYNVWAGGAWSEDAANWNDLAGESREGTCALLGWTVHAQSTRPQVRLEVLPLLHG